MTKSQMEFPRRFDLLQVIRYFSFVAPRPTQPSNFTCPIRSPSLPDFARVRNVSTPPTNMESMIEGMGVRKRGAWSMKEGMKNNSPKSTLVLVGRVLQEKLVNAQAFTETITPILSNAEDLSIKSIGGNRFIFTFKMKFDYTRALEEGPWHFDRALLVLAPLLPNQDPTNVVIKLCQFWVHLHDLPYFRLTQEVAASLTESLGKFIFMDPEQLRDGWSSSMRLRLELDVEEPLFKFLDITKMDGSVVAVRVTYERLPKFCYICGRLTHIDRHCVERVNYEYKDIRPFGEELRESQYRKAIRTRQFWTKPPEGSTLPKEPSPPSSNSRIQTFEEDLNLNFGNHDGYQEEFAHQQDTGNISHFVNNDFQADPNNRDEQRMEGNWVPLSQGNDVQPVVVTSEGRNRRQRFNLNEDDMLSNAPVQAFQLTQSAALHGGEVVLSSEAALLSQPVYRPVFHMNSFLQYLNAVQPGTQIVSHANAQAVQWINNVMLLSPSLNMEMEEPCSSRPGSKRQRTERNIITPGGSSYRDGSGWIFTGHQH